MKRLILVLLVTGCLYQGVASVYYVTIETEEIDKNGDGVQDGVNLFLVFKNREFEQVSFYDAECRAIVRVYQGEIVYEEEVLFDSSELVGRAGGIVITCEDVSGTGDIQVSVVIEGRGEFRSEKKDVDFG